jgi:hypothetical protein
MKILSKKIMIAGVLTSAYLLKIFREETSVPLSFFYVHTITSYDHPDAKPFSVRRQGILN